MTTTTPWSDTPPSEAGTYWVRPVGGKYEFPWECDKTGAGGMWSVADLEFGPRVLSAEETVKLTAEVERLRAENAELRATLVSVAAVDELPEYRSVPFADAGKIKVRVSGVTPMEPMPYPLGDGLDMDGNPIG